MNPDRRTLLKSAGLALATGVAGCSGQDGTETESPTGSDDATDATDATDAGDDESSASASANVAVAAEMNVLRARVSDALAFGVAGEFHAGARVAADIYERFEADEAEWGTHERMEKASHEAYENFEGAVERLEAGLKEEALLKARSAAQEATGAVRTAMEATVEAEVVHALDAQWFGARAADSGSLAAAGHVEAAATVADDTLAAFEDAPVHGALEDAASEAYEAFESGLKTARKSGKGGDGKTVESQAESALTAAIDGSYKIVGDDDSGKKQAGAGELATMQANGWNARALTRLGGPGESAAHAAVLNSYRLRAYDCHWLAAQGETDTAATMAADIYAHFEEAAAHEALEEANHDAYEGFEAGLEELETAINNGNSDGIDSAVAKVDSNLVTGISAVASADVAATIEAGFLRGRLADSWELYARGENNVAADLVGSLYERFEQDELGVHEAMEDADHDLYESFEGHLESLQSAYTDSNDSGAEESYTAAQDALLTFEEKAASEAVVSCAEASYMMARAFDAASVAALGNLSRAKTIVDATYQHFENGAGGFHEALENADHDSYESLEGSLEGVKSAAGNDSDVYSAATSFNADAVVAAYAVVEAAGSGEFGGVAATVVGDTFERFEAATVHETLEEANHDAYESFEGAMEAYQSALKNGKSVPAKLEAFVAASVKAEFAVVGAAEKAPAN